MQTELMTLMGALLIAATPAGGAAPLPATGSARSDDWRERIRTFAQSNLEHSAWGTGHARRNHLLTLSLARAEGIAVDEEAVYAAAYLHDMGAFPAYAGTDVDHAERAAALVDGILREAGFPMGKAALVRDIVAHHMYYSVPGASPEAVLFRDADTLDFLGLVGIARILSVTTRHRWAPDLEGALATIGRHMAELPASLRTASARAEGRKRVARMREFLAVLETESQGAAR